MVEVPAQCRASYYVVFIVRYWAARVMDSDNTGGCSVYGGIGNCVPKCSWESWGG